MKNTKVTLIVGLLLFVQMIVVRVISAFPTSIEHYYSNGLYPIISKMSRYVFGWLPFSFGDLMYSVLVILILRAIFIFIKKRAKEWKQFLVRILAISSIVYFAFHLLWGLNYYRLPLHQSIGIANEYTTEDLLLLTEKLIKNSNRLHAQLAPNDSTAVKVLTRDGNGAYQTPDDRAGGFKKAELFKTTLNGYNRLKTQFPKLEYAPKSIKTSLLSYPLSIMGYSGYLNPITNEAQINGLIPGHRWPVVSCHEQAHQLGYAKENEANFIAVLATLNNEDPYFQYSGSIFALRYCLSDVYDRDEEKAIELRGKIRPGILKNYAKSQLFWETMENPLEPFFKYFYTGYLKANNQPKGLETYNYMVALLVNYNKSFPEAL